MYVCILHIFYYGFTEKNACQTIQLTMLFHNLNLTMLNCLN
jgi:hypothetical protein